jgi:chloramphenicol 3-O phosphotransferase
VTTPREARRTTRALPTEPATAQIILLNGTSSSGKSSIAKELLRILESPYYHLSVDAFNAMRERRDLPPEALDEVLYRMRRGFHRAIAGMAAGGNNIVVDYVLSEPWRLIDCLEVFARFDVVFIGVHCSAPELERRERARGARLYAIDAKTLPDGRVIPVSRVEGGAPVTRLLLLLGRAAYDEVPLNVGAATLPDLKGPLVVLVARAVLV